MDAVAHKFNNFENDTRAVSLLRRTNVDSQRFGMSDDYFIALFDLAKSLDVLTDL